MNVAWAMLWGGSRSTKPCVFPCKVAAGDDERYLVCATGAVWIVSSSIGSSYGFCNEWLFLPDLPKDPSKIIQPLQEKSTLKKRLLFHAKKDCYFTQKKTLIFIKKRLLFFQAKHHHVYVCCMLKEKLDIM